MRLNPHLSFNGQCEAAFQYYEKCLGGRITLMMPHGDSPARIMHATLTLGDNVLTGGDAPPEAYQKPQGAAVLLQFDDAAEADRIFDALAEGGTVQMAIQSTFWAQRFGMLVDQFGIPWMINCGRPLSADSST